MPKVFLSEWDRACVRLSRWAYGEMRVRKISQETLADRRGISRQALGRKLKESSFDFKDFVFLVKEFEPDDKELRQIIGG